MGGLPTSQTANGFAADPENPKAMYVAMRDGLFKSVDAGDTWTKLGSGLKNLAAVTVNPRRSTEVYVATTDGHVFRSGDGGTTWTRQR